MAVDEGSETRLWEAVQLFRRHHEDGSPGALTTALLLCTDGRWDRCTARLIAGITNTSILGEDDLNGLADCFVWSDTFRFQYPVSWTGTEWVSIDPGGGDEAAEGSVVHLDPDTPPTRTLHQLHHGCAGGSSHPPPGGSIPVRLRRDFQLCLPASAPLSPGRGELSAYPGAKGSLGEVERPCS
jgi:hypothetical protein